MKKKGEAAESYPVDCLPPFSFFSFLPCLNPQELQLLTKKEANKGPRSSSSIPVTFFRLLPSSSTLVLVLETKKKAKSPYCLARSGRDRKTERE